MQVVISCESKQQPSDWWREPGVRRSASRSYKAADCFSSTDYSNLGLQWGQRGLCVAGWVPLLPAGWSARAEGPQLSCQRDFDFNEPMGLGGGKKKKEKRNQT